MLHCFTKSTIHTSDQPGPPSPYVGECRRTARVSCGTSNFIMDNAQECCVVDLGKCEVNPIGGDRRTDAKWIDGKRGTESACLRSKNDKCKSN